ncbi:hypothetical protein B0T19DRAFT_421870 [Cercophora scortea]|uniref:Uncharacterized protein n=1 Tax=Cercophora scortea TaxID=314031 RepID=A0AAE0IM57_9PEZI|nr:hypothetical protein B0T19DRAFT_421870 [Cercophora scortea]
MQSVRRQTGWSMTNLANSSAVGFTRRYPLISYWNAVLDAGLRWINFKVCCLAHHNKMDPQAMLDNLSPTNVRPPDLLHHYQHTTITTPRQVSPRPSKSKHSHAGVMTLKIDAWRLFLLVLFLVIVPWATQEIWLMKLRQHRARQRRAEEQN